MAGYAAASGKSPNSRRQGEPRSRPCLTSLTRPSAANGLSSSGDHRKTTTSWALPVSELTLREVRTVRLSEPTSGASHQSSPEILLRYVYPLPQLSLPAFWLSFMFLKGSGLSIIVTPDGERQPIRKRICSEASGCGFLCALPLSDLNRAANLNSSSQI